MKLGKKGVSSVIATVLILTVTLAAGAILSQVVIKYVNERLKGGDCFPYRDYLVIDDSLGYTCIKSSADKILYGVSIEGKPVEITNQENVTGFIMILSNKTSKNRIEVKVDQTPRFETGGIRIVDETSKLYLPWKGDIVTYVYNATLQERYDKVEIAPTLASGRVCPISTSAKLINCEGGLKLE